MSEAKRRKVIDSNFGNKLFSATRSIETVNISIFAKKGYELGGRGLVFLPPNKQHLYVTPLQYFTANHPGVQARVFWRKMVDSYDPAISFVFVFPISGMQDGAIGQGIFMDSDEIESFKVEKRYLDHPEWFLHK